MHPYLPAILAASALLLAQAPGPAAEPAPAAKAGPGSEPKAAAEPNVVQVPPNAVVAVLGLPVAGPDGEIFGRLVDVLVNLDGHPTAAVIDFGGFLGVGARKIAVRWNALHFAPGAKKLPIMLDWTVDQIRAAPEYISRHREAPVVVAPQPRAPEPKPSTTPGSR